jgi:tryptophanyl-tRNA synthetase
MGLALARTPLILLSLALFVGAARGSDKPLHRHLGSRTHLASRLERLERRTAFLHARLAEQLCAGRHDEATTTGAWCLAKGGELFGHPLAPLHFLDAGVAPAVFDLLSAGNATVLDVGAGSGQYGRYFLSRGFPAAQYEGVDGALNVEEFTSGFVRWADLSLPYDREGGPADWVMSLEVGEHLPAKYEATFLDTLHRNNRCGLVLSWAVPGQAGKGHVNCLSNAAVRERVEPRGYVYDAAFVDATRAKAELDWFKNTFMLFRRKDAPPECAMQ